MVQTVNQEPDYLIWRAPDQPVTVRMTHDLVGRLTVEIMRGFGVTRRRGTEAGGILLGRVDNEDPAVVAVQEFEAVPCEYAYGPSYVLSPADQERYAEAVARWKRSSEYQVVGAFRSHTREGLSIDYTDVQLFSRFLADTGRVFLLVKPFATRLSTASLVLPSGGELRPENAGAEFPFSTTVRELPVTPEFLSARPAGLEPVHSAVSPEIPTEAPSNGVVPTLSQPEPEPTPVPVESASEPVAAVHRPIHDQAAYPVPVPPPGAPATPEIHVVQEERGAGYVWESDEPQGSLWLPILLAGVFTVSALALGFVAGYQLAGGQIRVYPTPGLSTAAERSAAYPAFRAERMGERVRLRWSAPPEIAESAVGGALHLRDGDSARTLKLDRLELRSGTLLYQPASPQVRFTLEVSMPGDRTVTQSLTWPGDTLRLP